MLSEVRKSSVSPNAAPDFRLQHSRQQNREESPKQSTELGGQSSEREGEAAGRCRQSPGEKGARQQRTCQHRAKLRLDKEKPGNYSLETPKAYTEARGIELCKAGAGRFVLITWGSQQRLQKGHTHYRLNHAQNKGY